MTRSASHPCPPVLALLAALALLGALGGCKDEPRGPTEPNVGTNSNWLRACSMDAECGDVPSCECGACTRRCGADLDCDGLPDARCISDVSPSASQSCSAEGPAMPDASATPGPAASVCLPRCEPGDCLDGQFCVAGGCVLAALPALPFCDPARDPSALERILEDGLLAEINALRVAGGAVCGARGTQGPVPALRLDARLICSARVLARDLLATGSRSLTDSAGRTTETRVRASGYAPSRWGDAFSFDVNSSQHARELMLRDEASCAALTSSSFLDVGIGGAGDVLVVTLGAP